MTLMTKEEWPLDTYKNIMSYIPSYTGYGVGGLLYKIKQGNTPKSIRYSFTQLLDFIVTEHWKEVTFQLQFFFLCYLMSF